MKSQERMEIGLNEPMLTSYTFCPFWWQYIFLFVYCSVRPLSKRHRNLRIFLLFIWLALLIVSSISCPTNMIGIYMLFTFSTWSSLFDTNDINENGQIIFHINLFALFSVIFDRFDARTAIFKIFHSPIYVNALK